MLEDQKGEGSLCGACGRGGGEKKMLGIISRDAGEGVDRSSLVRTDGRTDLASSSSQKTIGNEHTK